MVKIQFLGAAETVTGSCYYVTTPNAKFLIDCGMFQGPEVEDRNLDAWPFTGNEIDFVLLTHAHIDHSGLIPKLVRKGFNGPIYATNNTVALSSLLLLDSAKIQELNAQNNIFGDKAAKPSMYSSADAQKANSQFKSIKYHQKTKVAKGVDVEYIPAGHILGAASIIVDVDGKRIAFSGDIGREEHLLIETFDPEDYRDVDYVVMESLYGGNLHPSRESSVYELINEIKETIDRGGNALVPAFAVERTQNLLIDLKRAKSSGTLSPAVKVFMDSPLATKVTKVYESSVASMKNEFFTEKDLDEKDLFGFPGLKVIYSSKQSQRLKNSKGSVIIAGSGMVNGGRILGHVVRHMPDPKSELILIGYQAEETYGRLLSEGARELVIDNIDVTIKGKVEHLEGFSAHGDENDLLRWLGRYKSDRLKKVFLVHAEKERSELFRNKIVEKSITNENSVVIPKWKEVIEI